MRLDSVETIEFFPNHSRTKYKYFPITPYSAPPCYAINVLEKFTLSIKDVDIGQKIKLDVKVTGENLYQQVNYELLVKIKRIDQAYQPL